MNQQQSFINAVNPYLSDVGVGLVFGLGYFLIKYLYKDKEEDKKKVTQQSKSQINFDNCDSVEDFNHLIKLNEENVNLNPFEVIERMNKAQLLPNVITYNNLLNACFIQSNFDYAERLSEDLFDFGSPVQPDLSTFNILLKGISCKMEYISPKQEEEKSKQLKSLEKILSLMGKHTDSSTTQSIKPNDVTLNTCMDILIKAGETKRAWELFDNMESNYNVKPDKYSFSTIIKALKYDPNPEKLEKAFGIIEQLKTQITSNSNDEIIFNCLIDVCVRLQLMEKAEKLFSEMKELKIEATKVTYAIMIKGYGQVYQIEKAFKVFEEMKLANLSPNEIVYGCLLNACVRCSNIRGVTEVYKEMKLLKLDMNVILYTTLIKAYTKVKDLNSALDVYYTMLNDVKITPNIIVHNAILDCCVECKDTKKLSEIYKLIRDNALSNSDSNNNSKHNNYNTNNNDEVQPDLITYSTVIKGYARAKEMDKVFDIYKFLKNNSTQYKLDEIIYNSILDGCAKTNNYDKALEIYQDMEASGIKKSNVTYSILVKVYSNAGEEEKAMALLEEMTRSNLKPGIIVYTCLIQTCLKSKKPYKAIDLFEKLKEGNTPDHVLYNTIINGCLYHNVWEHACRYTVESLNGNVKIATDLYNSVLFKLTAHYCNMKNEMKVSYASEILRLIKEKKVEIAEDVYSKVGKMIYQLSSTGTNFERQSKTGDNNNKYGNYSNGNNNGNGNTYYKDNNNNFKNFSSMKKPFNNSNVYNNNTYNSNKFNEDSLYSEKKKFDNRGGKY
jgi:pentatricopeptide repeat protein